MPHPPLHIGIVGCSAEGAALCYRTVCHEASALLGGHAHPEVTLHTPSLQRYVDCLERGDLEGVGALMLRSAEILAAAGAEILICPDNTIHAALPGIAARLPRPFLHIADAVAEEAARRGFRRLGLTGTQWLMESAVYPERLAAQGLELVIPEAAERAEIGRVTMEELVHGRFEPAAVELFRRVIERLQARGAEAVILGCTEHPLLMNDGNSPLPTLDSTRLLARAALERALART